MNARHFAREERTEFADFLATLSPEDWDAPTLCAGWRVRDVVAHVISYDELSARSLLDRLVQSRFRVDRANAAGVTALAQRSPDELLALVRAHAEPRGLTTAFGGRIALTDGLIHHQDIRRAFGRPREIPPDRLRRVLNFALVSPPLGVLKRTARLKLVATDLGWAAGIGQEVRGPGEAILMAMAGRRGVVGELSGPGQPTLASRIER
jgi:uncharacterized protein (TIGR03083 family)